MIRGWSHPSEILQPSRSSACHDADRDFARSASSDQNFQCLIRVLNSKLIDRVGKRAMFDELNEKICALEGVMASHSRVIWLMRLLRTKDLSACESAPSAWFCAWPKTQSLNIQQSLAMYYGCDSDRPIVDPINYAITISKPLTNISSPNSGTIRPAKGKRERLRVVLRIVFTTVAA